MCATGLVVLLLKIGIKIFLIKNRGVCGICDSCSTSVDVLQCLPGSCYLNVPLYM